MTFIFIAATAATIATAVVAWPLLRAAAAPRSVVAAGVAALAIIAGSAVLYAHWSTWDFSEPQAAETPAQMVAKLAKRLEGEPNDVPGWLMLGRSYVALGQFGLAERAYQRADRLEGGRNAEALAGLAETLVLEADGAIDERSGRLFEQALALSPDSEKALFYGAIVAQRRGDNAVAAARFEKLLSFDPPADVRPIIERQIAQLKAAPAKAPPATAAPAAAATGDATPSVRVAVELAPGLVGKVPSGATLFVFVRTPGQPGPPLAVKRLAASLPVNVELTPADSMLAGRSFAAGDTVEVSAKISRSGSATPAADDLVGRTSYVVGRDARKNISISGTVQ
ncbi:MAG: hypothetical protein EBR51_03780 [Gammaproteobacteria bacterium]|nr:hypothetical protein [Gammaproteobacteria bacterium]